MRWLMLGVLLFLLVSACSRDQHPNVLNMSKQVEDCHMKEHIMGDVCIPNHPDRIIAISQFTLGNILALGVQPIAAASAYTDLEDRPAYLQPYTQRIREVGDQYNPSLEKIALLKPDLILGWEVVRKIYPFLTQISPTAIVPWKGPATPSWQEHFQFLAKSLSKEKEHQQAWNRYYQRIEQLKTQLSDHYKNQTISLININPGNITSYVKNSFSGSILEDAGLHQPPAQDVVVLPLGRISGISEEKLDEVVGDILFVMVHRDRDKQFFAKLQQKPIWKTLKAVQQGRVYLVDAATWIGSNLLAADAVIDDLEKYLLNSP